jgi:hypothetical protein
MNQPIFNPGSEPQPVGSETDARANMAHFAADVAAQTGTSVEAPDTHTHIEDGRYVYTLHVDGREHTVEMPGLPLSSVRFTRAEGQNAWDFPRLWVDGASWLWKYAVDMCSREPDLDD